jgi:mono/diheme cytochrome c family protein
MTRSKGVLTALAVLCAAACLRAAIRPRAIDDTAHIPLHRTRQSPTDLELSGSLAGVPRGQTRFVSFADLSRLPLETYTVTDDPGLGKSVRITGLALERLPALLGATPGAAMVTAICSDAYAAHYPASYFHDHHPLLVMRIDGKPSTQWPKLSEGDSMGPYLVSHPSFKPAFQILSHADEAQVPWGVIRLDFEPEQQVYAPIAPRGPHAHDPLVQQGYTIAKQNCFRCHNRGGEGGLKADRPWDVVARRAATDPVYFDTYVRNPKRLNPAAQMEGSPTYNDATVHALRAYFNLFAETTP